jgi:predicted  nucleic acid-binding Zn-ribbon protein
LIFFHVNLNAQTTSIKKQLQLNTKKLENHEKLLQTAFDSIKSFVKQYSSVNSKIVEINTQLVILENKQDNFYNEVLIRLSQIEEFGENEIPSLRNQIDNLEQTYKTNSKQNEKVFSNIDLNFINSEKEFQSHIKKNFNDLTEINIKLKKYLKLKKILLILQISFQILLI